MIRRIKWKGEELVLITGFSQNSLEGAIATRDMYENNIPSIAHLYEDGDICQYGRVIGNINEIEFLGEEND